MGVPRHRHLFRKQVARIAPDCRPRTLHGAIRYYDCQVDDARLVDDVARTAASHGAQSRPGPRSRASCARASGSSASAPRDLETGRELEVRARVVVNAAGVWTDEIQQLAGGRGALHVQASKGIHLVVPRDRIRSEARVHHATESRCSSSSRGAGTGSSARPTRPGTSTRRTRPPAGPTSTTCSSTSTTILREPLDHDDVEGVYAGLRPLLLRRVRADRADLPRAHRGRRRCRAW